MRVIDPLYLLLIGVCMIAGIFSSDAADIVSVKGESTYYDDGTKSKVECMRLAAEQARIDALAKKFGTIVSQDILQTDRISGNKEHNDFLALSSTEVKGEWIADDGEPEYEFSRDAQENLVVFCRVKGKAREISNDSSPFEALVLRNGTDRRNADNLFRDGDDMFLYFRSATDGFLAVFLEDESGKVYLLLPYPMDSRTRVPVVKDNDYLFFSRGSDTSGDNSLVEEIMLTAPYNVEYNRLFVMYSPESFSRPVMEKDGGLPHMSSADFSKWLVKTRRNDPRMGVKAMNLQIAPQH